MASLRTATPRSTAREPRGRRDFQARRHGNAADRSSNRSRHRHRNGRRAGLRRGCSRSSPETGLRHRARSESRRRPSCWVWSRRSWSWLRWGSGSGRSSRRRSRPRRSTRAMQDYDDGDYRTAIRDFGSFLETNPRRSARGKARVFAAMANVRQYVIGRRGNLVVGARSDAGDGRASRWARRISRRASRPGRAGHSGRRRAGRPGAACRRTRRRWPKPSRRFRCTRRSPASRPWRSSTGRGCRPSCPRRAPRCSKAQVRSAALAAMDKAIAESSASRVYDARDAPGRPVCRPGSRQGPDCPDDGGQRADPPRGRRSTRRAGPPSALLVPTRSGRRPVSSCDRATSRPPQRPDRPRRSSSPWPTDLPTRLTAIRAPLSGMFRWAWPRTSCPPWSRARRRPWPSTPATATWSSLTRGPARSSGGCALGEPVGDPPLVLGNQLVQVLPSGKLLVDRSRLGRTAIDRQPGPSAGSHAGARRVGPAPLRAGTPGLPVRLGARSARRACRSIIWAILTARFPVRRRGWADSW